MQKKKRELRVTMVNVRGIKGKIKRLESLFHTEKIDISLFTETKMKKGDQISIKGYRWIEKYRTNYNGGGVGNLVSETIAMITTENSSVEDHELLETKWIECLPRNTAVSVFLHSPQPSNPTNKWQIRHHTSWRLQCKTKKPQENL